MELRHTKVENQVVAFEMGSLFKGFENHLLKLTAEYRYEQTKTKEQRIKRLQDN